MSNNLISTPDPYPHVLEEAINNGCINSQAMGKVAVNMPHRPLNPFEQAMRQIGMPRTDTYYTKSNGNVIMSVQDHMTETVKWHKAFIQVFEFMEAQLNVDPFKNDPEAKAIYIAWISKGLMSLRDEAGSGVMK